MSNYNTQLQSNNTDLQTVLEILQTKITGGDTPIISVFSNGLITATAGSKTSNHQLAFQAAKTITPGTTNQTAVSSGYYTGGAITVKGDSNLIADNIKSGVSIFGVNGTLVEDGSSENTDIEDALITRTFTSYINNRITYIANNVFYSCSNLTTVSFPKVISIGSSAFACCYKLTTVSFPVATSISSSAFEYCSKLTTVNFPAATSIGEHAFYHCSNLTTISFPVATKIGGYAFYYCSNLTTANFPAATSIGYSTFHYCSNLTTANFPAATSIGNNTFKSCSKLTTISFPVATTISSSTFANCTRLTTVSFPKVISIGSSAFTHCYNLKSFYLTGSSLCTLSNSNTFNSTPYAGYRASFSGTPYIYVPSSLIASYQAATNWAYFSSYFSAIESLSSAEIITFIIDGTEYQAEEGMTWDQWCISNYNVGEFFIDNDGYVCVYADNINHWVWGDQYDTSAQYYTEVITKMYSYSLNNISEFFPD